MVTRLGLGQWYPSPFAARQAQGVLLERTPQDSRIVVRPPTLRRSAVSSAQAEQLGLLAASQSASRSARPVRVAWRRTGGRTFGV